MDSPDPVLADIRKLREGRGLIAGRIQERGALMSSLGTSDPQEALNRFTAVLEEMEDTPGPGRSESTWGATSDKCSAVLLARERSGY
jgi:hypothetical protein